MALVRKATTAKSVVAALRRRKPCRSLHELPSLLRSGRAEIVCDSSIASMPPTSHTSGRSHANQRRKQLPSHLYLGLAGETGKGRVVHSGLFRLTDGSNEWEALPRGLPEMPAIRALAVHPLKREIIYAGTQSRPYRSAACVVVCRRCPGSAFHTPSPGLFRSIDGGDYWRHVPLDPSDAKGQIYCRAIREVPGTPRQLWVAAGSGFISDVGVLLHSRHGGD